MAKFPSYEELKKIRKLTSRMTGSQGLAPNATVLDRAKYKTCEKIIYFKIKKKLSNRQLAQLLGCAETRVSEMTNYRIEKFTLDRLISYAQSVDPGLSLKVA